MKRKWLDVLLVILPAIAVVLTALPEFEMHFFGGFTEYVSGFDTLLLGYGDFGPMAAGVLSILLTVRGILRWKRSGEKTFTGMALAALLCSLFHNILSSGANSFSWTISGVLLVNLAVNAVARGSVWNGGVLKVVYCLPAVLYGLLILIIGINMGFQGFLPGAWLSLVLLAAAGFLLCRDQWWGCIPGMAVGVLTVMGASANSLLDDRAIGIFVSIVFAVLGLVCYRRNQM